MKQELIELKERCIAAAEHGYVIGRADKYVENLQKEVGVPELKGIVPNSPQHLLLLLDILEKGVKATAKVEVKAEVKAETHMEVEHEQEKPKKKGR